jgi:hypothetical protein
MVHSEPIQVLRVIPFVGPNSHGPQPGVLLEVRCDRDRSGRIRTAIKDGAQYVGLVLGHLTVESYEQGGTWLIRVFFSTPAPDIGAELVRYVADGVRATALGDEEWDRDTPLYELQRRRRHQAPPLPLLQMEAEARARGLPMFRRGDGLQIGYGARGWATDLQAPAPPPWNQIGRAPLLAVSGAAARSAAMVALAAAGFQALDDPDFAAARALLADPGAQRIALGLDAALIASCGLPFDRCDASAILDFGTRRPATLDTDEDWARAIGVPMLTTKPDGVCLLNADEPAIVALAPFAPCLPILLSCVGQPPPLQAHRRDGGRCFFLQHGRVVAALGSAERDAGAAPEGAPAEVLGALAALALRELVTG